MDPGATGMVVLLLLFVGAAYLLTHFVLERLQRTLLVVLGLEYVLLGVLLGPMVPEIRAFEDLDGLLPVIALAAGWIGLLRGMALDTSEFDRSPPHSLRLAVLSGLVPGLLVLAAAFYFFRSPLMHAGVREAWLAAGVLACCASIGATDPLDVVEKRYVVHGGVVPLLRRSARLGDVIALFVFGLLFCILHEDVPNAPLVLRPTEWAVVGIGLGGALGLLFRVFLAGDESENGRFLALVGIITFASGAAWFLNLSGFLVNVVLGAILVNTTAHGAQIRQTLERTESPMHLVLLVFAGALWQPPDPLPTVAAFCGFVALRLAGKRIGAALAGFRSPIRSDLHRGLLGHGVVTVAMAISFRLVYDGPAVDAAYTVVLASIVFHHLAAPRAVRALLVDAGELRQERDIKSGTGTVT